MHNFNVESVVYNYMLQLLHTNHNQAAYKENKRKFYFILCYIVLLCVKEGCLRSRKLYKTERETEFSIRVW